MQSSFSRKGFHSIFQPLDRNSRVRAVSIVFAYAISILASVYLGQILLHQGSLLSGLGIAALMVFIATRLRGLNNIIHECTHRSFARNRGDNVVLGSLSAALVFNSFDAYQKEHVSHHINRGNYEMDLDFHHRKSFQIEEPLSRKVIAKHILTPIFGLHLFRYFRLDMSAADGLPYLGLKIAMLLAFAIFAFIDPMAAFLLIFLPYAWIYTAINYWTDCIDHGGILTREEEIEASRNFVIPKPMRAILFPRNNCFHLLHHLFPNVPSQHFDDCHKVLLADPAYREVH
jgi:fatty acid desaturase